MNMFFKCKLPMFRAMVKAPAGCRVVTEEVVRGGGAVEFRKNDPNAMHRGHDLWLSSLKHVSEKEQTPLPKKISADPEPRTRKGCPNPPAR